MHYSISIINPCLQIDLDRFMNDITDIIIIVQVLSQRQSIYSGTSEQGTG